MPADGTSPASVSADRLPPVANLYGRPLVVHKCALHKKAMKGQMEGLVVDKGITLCDLKGMLDQLVKKMFGKNVRNARVEPV